MLYSGVPASASCDEMQQSFLPNSKSVIITSSAHTNSSSVAKSPANNNNNNNNGKPINNLTNNSSAISNTFITDSASQLAQRGKRNAHDILLETLDVLVSCLIVAPCVIAYWRGTWELMRVLIFPNNVPLSAACSMAIGGVGHFVFTVTQNYFKDYIHPDKRRLTYYVISRCYTAVFGIVCVNMWRGSWVLCDWLTSADSLLIVSIVTLVALLFLIATRTVRNLSAAPYTVTMDHKTDYFEVDTMFKIPGFHQPGLYLLDTLFSVFVIGTLVVIAWRGLWGIMDLTLYVGEFAKSAWASLILGYIAVAITFVIQPFVRCMCRKLDDGFCKLFICDIFHFMTFFGAVNAWRGIWNLLDVYLYPDNPILSYWLTHVLPFLILAALKCSNSLLVRGVFIDAEGSDGECVDVPINYVQLHFQRERSKKQLWEKVLLAADEKLDKEVQNSLLENANSKQNQAKIQSGLDVTVQLL